MEIEDTTPLVYDDLPTALKLLYSCLRKYGLYSRNKFKRYVPMSLCFLIGLILLALALIQRPGDVFKFIIDLEEIMVYVHMMGKITGLVFTQDKFNMLFKQTNLFWDVKKCDKKTKTSLNAISSSIVRLQKGMGLILVLGVGFAMILAYCNNVTIVGIWTLEGYDRLYQFRSILMGVAFFVYVPILWAVDCLFIALCAETVIQFRILCYCLRNWNECNSDDADAKSESVHVEKLIACIKHHQFLQRFAKLFLSSFSSILLVEFITIGPLVCAELYAASESFVLQLQIRHTMIFLFHITDIFCFCIAANFVTHEASEVANAVYFSKWCSKDMKSLKIFITILTQNAQKKIVVTAGGMLTVNAAAALNVLKAAWSLLSLMKGLK